MKVGDYVRTKDGEIGEIRVIIEDKVFMNTNQYYSTNIIKSSPNIIDLLKKDDLAVDYNDDIYKVNKIYKGYVFTDKKNKYGQVITLVDYQIKYIVTKEQFESMEYKVGE